MPYTSTCSFSVLSGHLRSGNRSGHIQQKHQAHSVPCQIRRRAGDTTEAETKSWLLRENQGSWVRLPLPPARGRDQTASILQFNLCSLNMGDWCLVGHPRASIKEHKSCYRSMSFWRRCWELGRTGCSSTPLLAGQKQRGEGGEEESMTWVLSHCPWGMMASPAMSLVQQLECSVPAGCTLVLKATGLQWPLKVGSIPLRKCLNMAGTKDPWAA